MKEELPVNPLASPPSEAAQVFTPPQHNRPELEPIECYFHELPHGARSLVVVRLQQTMGDWAVTAEKGPKVLVLVKFFFPGAPISSGLSASLWAVILSLMVGLAAIVGLVVGVFWGRSIHLFDFVLIFFCAVTASFLLPAYLIGLRFSRYIHDKLLELEEIYFPNEQESARESAMASEPGGSTP